MSDATYDYDENSETWPYFVLTGLLVPLIPATISVVYQQIANAKQAKKDTNFAQLQWYKAYNADEQDKYRMRKRKRSLLTKRTIFVVIGWVLVVILALKIHKIEVVVSENNFDPWRILGIDESTPEKEIKKAYRKMSLKFHPDKVDTSNMTQEEIDSVDQAFVSINKAYKALTDETVRENFQKYGNPDGPGEIKHGIALPKFLVDGPTSPLLVIVYIFLIAVILPLVVGKWWSGVKSHTKQGIYTETASEFLQRMINFDPAKMPTVRTVLRDVSNAKEYTDIDRHLTPSRVYELLLAQLSRTQLSPKDEQLKMNVVAATPRLLLGYLDISTAFRNTDVSYAIIEAHRGLVQALDIQNNSSVNAYRQILQLPSVELKKLDTTQKMFTLGKLLKKPTEEPAKFLGVDNTSKVLEAASQIPIIEPISCKFKVPGENIVPPSSHVHIDFRFVIKSPAIHGKPDVSKLSEKVVKNQLDESLTLDHLRDPYKIVHDQPKVELPTAPAFFPDTEYLKNHCGWVALMVVQKDGKLGDAPSFITRAQMSNMTLSQEQMDKSDAQVSVFKFPVAVQTPNQEGKFQFRLVLKNLVYYGSDLEIPLVMEVKNEPVEPEKEAAIEGIEKTIEGQSSSSDDESSSEEEDGSEYESEESDWTDLDTDTEVESDSEPGK